MATKTNTKEVQVQTTEAEVKRTTSSRIRELHAEGKTKSEIVKLITAERGKPILYQHVRNVLMTPLKRPAGKAE